MTDGIHYRVQDLGAGRGQLHRDIVIDGELVEPLCEAIGSPAPIDSIERFRGASVPRPPRPTNHEETP